jgi:lipoprotein-anchoring transpeptidase ErfK/SrfK
MRTTPQRIRSRDPVRIIVAAIVMMVLHMGFGGVTASAVQIARTQGGAVSAVADVSTHQFTVSIGDQVVRTMPASMGKPGYETPLGTFEVLEKDRYLVMDSSTYGVPVDSPEGYRIDTEFAVRLTWGGIYVHSAPWSVDSQGYENVSHGCINLSPEDAQWFYENVEIGGLVTVVD